MARGDVTTGLSSVAAGAVLDLLPGAAAEWVIYTIYHQGTVDLQWYDGANVLTFESALSGPNAITNAQFHCTSTRRIRVKNVDASAMLIGFDGIVLK